MLYSNEEGEVQVCYILTKKVRFRYVIILTKKVRFRSVIF